MQVSTKKKLKISVVPSFGEKRALVFPHRGCRLQTSGTRHRRNCDGPCFHDPPIEGSCDSILIPSFMDDSFEVCSLLSQIAAFCGGNVRLFFFVIYF